MIYIELEELLHVANRILPSMELRYLGMLQSAVARPRASAFGEDTYPSLPAKVAALLHSIARDRGRGGAASRTQPRRAESVREG